MVLALAAGLGTCLLHHFVYYMYIVLQFIVVKISH